MPRRKPAPPAKPDLDQLAEIACDQIDEICGPDKMTKAQAKEFLEILSAILDGRVEALAEEIANEATEET